MTISKREMINRLHRALVNCGKASDLNKTEISHIIDTYATLIGTILLNGQSYRLGDIGTLSTVRRKAGRVRIPKTETFVDIPAKTKIQVKAAPGFSALLNAEEA